jgi:uncharacterized NAD-dependent epimerase/dehydratase family protein
MELASITHEPRGISLRAPYLLFLGDTTEAGFAKTAFGLRDWAGERCVGELVLPGCSVSTGLKQVSAGQAAELGARSLVIGVANPGGVIAPAWVPALIGALDAGLDIVSGMHGRLADNPAIAEAAARSGRQLTDVRTPPADIEVASGLPRSGRRILTVGTDCALGKKYTALAVARGLSVRGVDADFRATGQTGIMIAGSGVPIDAVISDFVAGAAEMLSPEANPDHVDVIEGQGSLFHPAYAAVSLGLLHGSQPDRFIVCHDPLRSQVLGNPAFSLPSIGNVIEMTIALGRLTNPAIACAGISLNTAALSPAEAETALSETERHLGLPCADPLRGGERFERLLDACLA